MTNIPKQLQVNNSDFVDGDYVVLTSPGTKDGLLEIIDHKYMPDMYRVKILSTGLCGPVFKGEIHPATAAELEAKRRLPKPDSDMGDDAHIENHISPLCLSDSRKNESQSPLSIKQDALSRMESCYIEQKKHVELLQTEVTRLNSTVERLKAENVVMQVELDKSRNQAYKHLESCENSLNSQTERFDELSEKVFKVFEIINNPDNHYCPFGWVAEQIQAVLGEVQGEVA